MENFEEAILINFSQDASIPSATKQKAYELCTEVRNSGIGWKVCLEKSIKSKYMEVQFWCLQVVLDQLNSIDVKSRMDIITQLTEYIHPFTAQSCNYAVMSRFCLLYVRLVQMEYPHNWPTAFSALVELVENQCSCIGLYIRMLQLFDMEVVQEYTRSAEDREQNMKVKDAMRDHDIERIAMSWYNILRNAERLDSKIIEGTLDLIGKYISWIDINLIANEQFLPILLSLSDSSSEHAEHAFECLAALVYKRMDASKKIELLKHYKILDSLFLHIKTEGEESRLLKTQGEALNTIGIQILEAFLSVRDEYSASDKAELADLVMESWKMLEKSLKVSIDFFSSSEQSASSTIHPFLTEFFHKLKSIVSDPTSQSNSSLNTTASTNHSKNHRSRREDMLIPIDMVTELLRAVLGICLQRMERPTWYCFDHSEDDFAHTQIDDFRKGTGKLFSATYAVSEQLSLSWMSEVLLTMCEKVEMLSYNQIESVLFIFSTAAQQYRDLMKELKRGDHPFNECLKKMLNCNILMNVEHPELRLLLLSLFVRFSTFFQLNTAFIPMVLEMMLDSRGLFSAHPRVASQTAMMLLRFVKRTLTNCEMYTQQIVSVLPAVLELSDVEMNRGTATKYTLEFTDQLLLYEMIGWLIGGRNASSPQPKESKKLFLRSVLTPLTTKIQQTCAAPSTSVDEETAQSLLLSKTIQAMAALSKGFLSKNGEYSEEWRACLNLTHHALQRHNASSDVRGAALFLCRRMLSVLGATSLEVICSMLPMMYEVPSIAAADISELGVFVVHMIVTFKEDAHFFLKAYFLRLFELHYECWESMTEDSPEYEREKNEAQRLLCQICLTISSAVPSVIHDCCVFPDKSIPGSAAPRTSSIVPSFLIQSLRITNAGNTNALLYAVHSWTNLIKFALRSPSAEQAAACVPVARIFDSLLPSLASLDISDPSNIRILQDTCLLFQVLLGSTADFKTQNSNLHHQLQNTFYNAIVNTEESKTYDDGRLLATKLVDGSTLQDCCEALKSWIVKQQMKRRL